MTALPQHHIFRVTYEAFAQFSSALTKTRDLSQVADCLESRVKYLFDYRLLRISFRYELNWIHLTLDNGLKEAEVTHTPKLYSYEKELVENKIPKIWEVKNEQEIIGELGLNPESHRSLWGWHFDTNLSREITISLVTGKHDRFSTKSVPFIKLFMEILESKLTELALFEELSASNERIKSSLQTIAEKNSEIETIIDQQEEIIQKQTEDLKKRNENLVEISVLNAHKVREPLSRIIGLINLLKVTDEKEVKGTFLPMIEKSSEELDEALKEVIDMAVKNLPKYQV